MKGKYVIPIALLLILASIFGTQCAFAQNDQATSTVILNYLTVSLTYPSHVTPGQLVGINVTAQAKEAVELASLNVQVYSADQNDLRQLLSTTVFANTMMLSGEQISKGIQVTVPSGAPRTSLVAQVTESVGATYPYGSLGSYTYTYNPYNYPPAYPYYPYPYYPNSYYGYDYGYSPYYSTYSPYTYGYSAGSDDAITSLSYVLAPTPEYVALQSQNQQLQSQNQQLQQQLQALQNSTAQKDSTINGLNSQLSSLQGTSIVVEIIAVILAIALVAVTALHLKSTRTSNATPPPKTEEKTTA